MHVYFSGIGGTGIGPLALVAHQAGFAVSGSDKQDSSYIHYLREKGVTDIHIGQTEEQIAAIHAASAIDWFVYSSAITKENADHPELRFCQEHGIKISKRDEFLSDFLDDKRLKLIAIAGTHGKTTTTAMTVWLFKKLGLPESHVLPTKSSFSDMGEYNPDSEYFIYEADEYDRNFLAFESEMSIITGIDWDHPDVYPTREDYSAAFRQFLEQSRAAVVWDDDIDRLGMEPGANITVISKDDPDINTKLHLPGLVNRQNAWAVVHAVEQLTGKPRDELFAHLNNFPGIARRFEKIAPNIYTDYAHTPPKIRGALQLAHEIAGDNVVVVYEGLHNTRQHFIKDDIRHLFDSVKQLYIVPSYLAREDKNLALLTPEDLRKLLDEPTQARAKSAKLDAELKANIQQHAASGETVLCLTAGGGNSLDEWLRREFHDQAHSTEHLARTHTVARRSVSG